MKKSLYVTGGVIGGVALATTIGAFATTGTTLEDVTSKVRGSFVELDYQTVPQSIRDYVSVNYSETTIEITKEDDGGIEIELSDGTDLIFEVDGIFREIEKKHGKKKGKGRHRGHDCDGDKDDDDIAYDEIPQNIKDYVSTNYSGSTIVEAEIEDDGAIEVELDNDTDLLFKADGIFREVEQ